MSDYRFTKVVIYCAIFVGIVTSVIFLKFPNYDIDLASLLFSAESGFVHDKYSAVNILRNIFIISFLAWYITIAVSFLISTRRNTEIFSIKPIEWSYMCIASILGPLILTNGILKEFWGRARPRELVEFGGKLEFSPAFYFSDQCADNCSFVSGETSSMVMAFIALAFVVKSKRFLFVTLAILLGALSGYLRMAQGGHFASDVLLAGVFMALVAALVYWTMFLRQKKTA